MPAKPPAGNRAPAVTLKVLTTAGFDGYELLARLRQAPQGARVTVIVLSNYGELDVIHHGVAMGVAEHLVKSQTTPSALAAAIRRHLTQTVPPT